MTFRLEIFTIIIYILYQVIEKTTYENIRLKVYKMRPLKELFGNKSAGRVLLFMQNYGEGYGREIADTFNVPQPVIRNQLLKLEDAGWLVSRPIGRTRLYSWNPGNPLVKPLRGFLEESLEAIPEEVTYAFFRQRRRPRKPGKPL